jgi:CDP-diacylglycerol--glycerol-3-phosphate 3-phosphatidyltransferase
VANVSYIANSISDLTLPAHIPDPFKNKVEYTQTILQQFKMFKYDNRVKIPAGHDLKIEEYFDNLEKYNNNYQFRTDIENLIEFKHTQKEFLKLLIDENKDKKLDFLESSLNLNSDSNSEKENTSYTKNPLMHKPDNQNKVLIFPSFQFFNINQLDDQEILSEILSQDKTFSKIRFSTGYLNPTDFMTKCFKKADYELHAVTSSPRANSFYKAGFLKKNIPYFYRRYEQIFLNNLKDKNFSLFEFERTDWSFHSKGIWFYEKDSNELPTMTTIGSSNYNSRSFERDVESQFYVYSFCKEFSKRLHQEAEECFYECKKVELKDINSDKDVKIKLRHKIMAKLFKKYL